MRILIVGLWSLLWISMAWADTLTLHSGKILEGKVIEQTAAYVKFDDGSGVVLTYYADEVASVNKVSASAQQPVVETQTPDVITEYQQQRIAEYQTTVNKVNERLKGLRR